MADNTVLNTGTGGDTIATDDIAGVKHQLVKVEYGVADSATPVSTTNPLPVDVTNASVADGGALPAKGVQVGGTDGSVFQVMSTDNAGRPNVNVNGTVPVSIAATQSVNEAQVAGTAVDVNSGLKSAGTQRVTLATDQVQLTNALKVDGSAVTQPVSGTVSITANSAVNVAQVAGTATDVNSGVKSAGTQRVVLATDQPQLTNALKVDGSAVTQPVSGTVTANAGTGPFPVSDNAGSLTVDATAATFGVNQAQVSGTAISVNSGAKDAGTQRVILASDQTVVPISDNAGSLTVDAPVATPAFVRLSDGSAAITTLPVSVAAAVAVTDNSGSLTVDAPVGTPVFTTVTPSATGGWSKIKYAAQTTTVVKPKGTAGTFGGYYAYNPNASVAYIQVFDLATATTVTLGTTVPDMIFGIPAASAANLEITNGVNMALGMQLACTTTATGSTAPATGLDLTVLFK